MDGKLLRGATKRGGIVAKNRLKTYIQRYGMQNLVKYQGGSDIKGGDFQ